MVADAKGALLQRIASAGEQGLASAEEWKRLGGEAYKIREWEEALSCYTSALKWCPEGGDLEATCLNNRAACHAQLEAHAAVVADTTRVLARQPANVKALMRRMVALEATGQLDKALVDAGSVLTMEPKNQTALDVVSRKKKSLTTKATDRLEDPKRGSRQTLAVFLFTQDRPLQCYACLRSLRKHARQVHVEVHVFWQSASDACTRSYQLLQSLPEMSKTPGAETTWVDCSRGQLFSGFSRAVNALSLRGQHGLLLLSDTVLFHSDVDLRSALDVLRERDHTQKGVFACRLDINPRVDFFPGTLLADGAREADLVRSAPALKSYDRDPGLLLWTRWYDKTKMAYEAVPRERGWDAVLDWTATVLRTASVQHFFSALLPPPADLAELDRQAADWLSRRQRMKVSEIAQCTACYRDPVLVSIDPSEFGTPEAADGLLRAHLLASCGGTGKLEPFGRRLGWEAREVEEYFRGVKPQLPDGAARAVRGLLEPELFRPHYFSSVRVPAVPPACALPKAVGRSAPLVSWLVPARNAEHFLMDCLSSIEKQSGIDAGCWEVIVVEDASEDGTLAVARKFAEGRPHVKVIDNPKQMGVGGALCEGWPHCQGDFVARLDADDLAAPERLLKQLRYLEQHKTISVLGGRVLPFWTETRKCTVEKCGDKSAGRVAVVAWREFHGNQTSRRRETFTLVRVGDDIVLEDAPAEYDGCKVVRIGDESLVLNPDKWREALKSAQGHRGDVTLQRRDPAEQERGSRFLHPTLIRAMGIFEECLLGTTATFRREHFPRDDGPFWREESDQWCWSSLEPHQPASNLADTVVHQRRHDGNREQVHARAISESALAAVQCHLTSAYGVDVDLHDAAALRHFSGPRSADQGQKLAEVLQQVERCLVAECIRPRAAEGRGEFWRDFVEGREEALERAVASARAQFQAVVNQRAEVVTRADDDSPRGKRSRTPPR